MGLIPVGFLIRSHLSLWFLEAFKSVNLLKLPLLSMVNSYNRYVEQMTMLFIMCFWLLKCFSLLFLHEAMGAPKCLSCAELIFSIHWSLYLFWWQCQKSSRVNVNRLHFFNLECGENFKIVKCFYGKEEFGPKMYVRH